MAQAKKTSARRGPQSKRQSPKASTKGRSSKASTHGKSSRAKKGTQRVAERATTSGAVAANAALAGKAAVAGTRAAGRAVSLAASRAKVPVIAGGAAAAGLAGGLVVIARRQGRSRRNGTLDFDNVVAAAKRLGSFGEEIGRAATAIQTMTEDSKASK